jgi:hypothetical protein
MRRRRTPTSSDPYVTSIASIAWSLNPTDAGDGRCVAALHPLGIDFTALQIALGAPLDLDVNFGRTSVIRRADRGINPRRTVG